LREHTRLEVAAVHALGEALAPAPVGQQPPPAVGDPAQVQQRDLQGLAWPRALGPRGAQPLPGSPRVRLQKAQRLLQARVLELTS
jgi:hypothetical protein